MVAAAVLLDGGLALGALFRVGVDPVGRLGVVVALLDPLADERALHGVVPVLGAGEAERVAALALDRPRVHVADARRVVAVGRRAPTHQAVALYIQERVINNEGVSYFHVNDLLSSHRDEAVGGEVLVLECNPGVFHEPEDSSVIDEHLTVARRTLNALGRPFVHYLHSEVLRPAVRAVQVPALQPRHGL